MYKMKLKGRRAVAFSRVASASGNEQQHAEQLAVIAAAADAKGLQLLGEISMVASKEDDLLRAILNKHAEVPFDVLIISAVNRLSRDFFSACELYIRLKFEGIAVIAADCNI